MVNTPTPVSLKPSLTIRMFIGAAIGLVLISLFVFGVQTDPAWGNLWRLRPIIVVPLAGAIGGLCNYYVLRYHAQFGIHRVVAILISAIIFLIGLWMGTIVGLDGTLWD